MKTVFSLSFRAAAGLSIALMSAASQAAFTNVGDWQRGDVGTVYAEWDLVVNEAAGPLDPVLDTTPDIGSANVSSAALSLQSGIVTSTGNLYTANGTGPFSLSISADANGSNSADPVEAILQVATYNLLDSDSLLLNGFSADLIESSVIGSYTSAFGSGDIYGYSVSWLLSPGTSQFDISFNTAFAHTSVTELAFDAAAVTAVPVPASAWLLGSAMLGLSSVARRRSR